MLNVVQHQFAEEFIIMEKVSLNKVCFSLYNKLRECIVERDKIEFVDYKRKILNE